MLLSLLLLSCRLHERARCALLQLLCCIYCSIATAATASCNKQLLLTRCATIHTIAVSPAATAAATSAAVVLGPTLCMMQRQLLLLLMMLQAVF
jgi:hypothetical protein